ncbi:MAG TPA: glycerol-3-phosphate dehydrogenase C-terminal domain-containing protein, partial [Candidatus Nanopelagicaceae bacterium]
DAVDAAIKDLDQKVSKSSTKSIPIIGAAGYRNLIKQIPLLAQSYSVSTACVERLLNRYGSLVSDIFQMISKNPSLAEEVSPGSGYIKAEVIYAVTHEGARSLVDILARRLRLTMEVSNQGVTVSRELAELAAPTLGWSASDIDREVTAFEKYVDMEMAAIK